MKWRYYHTVWLVMSFAWATHLAVRMGLSPALGPIREEFNLSFAEAGLLAAANFYAFTFTCWPAGMLGDRLGRRLMLMLGVLAWAIPSLLTGMVSSFLALFGLRFVTGIAGAAFFGSDRATVASATPPAKMGLGQGLSFAGHGFGMGFGILLAGLITANLGWRMVFVLYALPALLAFFLVWRFVAEPPRPPASEKVSFRLILTNRTIWLINLGGMAVMYALWMVSTWAPQIIMETAGQDLTAASLYASLLGFAAPPGLLTMGFLSDYFKNRGLGRKFVTALTLAGVAVVMALLGVAIETRQSAWSLSILMVLAGFVLFGFASSAFSIYAEIAPRPMLGLVFGFSNTVWFLSSLVAPWSAGLLRDVTGSFGPAFFIASTLAILAAVAVFAVAPAFRLGPELPLVRAQTLAGGPEVRSDSGLLQPEQPVGTR